MGFSNSSATPESCARAEKLAAVWRSHATPRHFAATVATLFCLLNWCFHRAVFQQLPTPTTTSVDVFPLPWLRQHRASETDLRFDAAAVWVYIWCSLLNRLYLGPAGPLAVAGPTASQRRVRAHLMDVARATLAPEPDGEPGAREINASLSLCMDSYSNPCHVGLHGVAAGIPARAAVVDILQFFRSRGLPHMADICDDPATVLLELGSATTSR